MQIFRHSKLHLHDSSDSAFTVITVGTGKGMISNLNQSSKTSKVRILERKYVLCIFIGLNRDNSTTELSCLWS